MPFQLTIFPAYNGFTGCNPRVSRGVSAYYRLTQLNYLFLSLGSPYHGPRVQRSSNSHNNVIRILCNYITSFNLWKYHAHYFDWKKRYSLTECSEIQRDSKKHFLTLLEISIIAIRNKEELCIGKGQQKSQ